MHIAGEAAACRIRVIRVHPRQKNSFRFTRISEQTSTVRDLLTGT
jgi:hypothetical protein